MDILGISKILDMLNCGVVAYSVMQAHRSVDAVPFHGHRHIPTQHATTAYKNRKNFSLNYFHRLLAKSGVEEQSNKKLPLREALKCSSRTEEIGTVFDPTFFGSDVHACTAAYIDNAFHSVRHTTDWAGVQRVTLFPDCTKSTL